GWRTMAIDACVPTLVTISPWLTPSPLLPKSVRDRWRGGKSVDGHFLSQLREARQHTIANVLQRSALRDPAKTAIRCGELEWSFKEFDEVCNRLGRGLLAKGVAAGDRIAIVSRNSHSFAALRFAVARIGAVLVPINFMLNAKEMAFVLKNSGAKALAIGPGFTE